MNVSKIQITDFRFIFRGAGHYDILYTSPTTEKIWFKLVTDMTIVDEFKGTETSDHKQKRLNWLKSYVKKQ